MNENKDRNIKELSEIIAQKILSYNKINKLIKNYTSRKLMEQRQIIAQQECNQSILDMPEPEL